MPKWGDLKVVILSRIFVFIELLGGAADENNDDGADENDEVRWEGWVEPYGRHRNAGYHLCFGF